MCLRWWCPAGRPGPAGRYKMSAFYVTLMFFQNLIMVIELEATIFRDR